jgi:hypothetical protein
MWCPPHRNRIPALHSVNEHCLNIGTVTRVDEGANFVRLQKILESKLWFWVHSCFELRPPIQDKTMRAGIACINRQKLSRAKKMQKEKTILVSHMRPTNALKMSFAQQQTVFQNNHPVSPSLSPSMSESVRQCRLNSVYTSGYTLLRYFIASFSVWSRLDTTRPPYSATMAPCQVCICVNIERSGSTFSFINNCLVDMFLEHVCIEHKST